MKQVEFSEGINKHLDKGDITERHAGIPALKWLETTDEAEATGSYCLFQQKS